MWKTHCFGWVIFLGLLCGLAGCAADAPALDIITATPSVSATTASTAGATPSLTPTITPAVSQTPTFTPQGTGAAVSATPGAETPTPAGEVTEGPAPSPTREPTWTPFWTPSPTPTVTPPPTPTLRYTYTPTPEFLALPGTPLPGGVTALTVENASQVTGLAGWQETTVVDLDWLPFSSLLTLATDKSIKFYDMPTRQELRSLYPKGEGVVDIDFSPSGNWLVSGSRRGSEKKSYFSSVELWWGPDWRPLGILYDVPRGLSRVSFSPDGRFFTASFASPVEAQNSVEAWYVNTWVISGTLFTGAVLDYDFSPDGKLLAVTPDRYAVRIWDMKNNKWLLRLSTSFTGAVNNMLFSPDGSLLATGHYDGVIRLWDIKTGRQVLEMSAGDGSVIESLAFSPDGRLIASGSGFDDQYVRLWSAGTGELLRILEGHSKAVTSLLFEPQGGYLISADYDGEVRVWGIRP